MILIKQAVPYDGAKTAVTYHDKTLYTLVFDEHPGSYRCLSDSGVKSQRSFNVDRKAGS